MHLKINFERTSCTNEIYLKEDMDDETLPLEMMRLIDQQNKQILPHQKVTEVINLGSNEETKKKIDTALSVGIKKEIISLLHKFSNVFA